MLRLLVCAALAAPAAASPTAAKAVRRTAPAPVVLAQIRLDASAMGAPGAVERATLPREGLLRLESLAAAAAVPADARLMAADEARAEPGRTDAPPAARRLALAGETLGRFDAAAFARLPLVEQERHLARLWDQWEAHGLVSGASSREEVLAEMESVIAAAVAGDEGLVLAGSNKSASLGAGVLGYPLQAAMVMRRERIGDSLEYNALRYPAGQEWVNAHGTPEVLAPRGMDWDDGRNGHEETQALVDLWGRAVEHARAVLSAVEAGDPVPESPDVAPAATAAFARLVRRLRDGGSPRDRAALRYLHDRDPTFVAFLLDANKPGYYPYNAEDPVVNHVVAAANGLGFGLRRHEQPEGRTMSRAVYFYRPRRVAERFYRLAYQNAEDPESVQAAALLRPYADRLMSLADGL